MHLRRKTHVECEGLTSFLPVNHDVCKHLAQLIFDERMVKNSSSSLKYLELRFPRRWWVDRGQFWTVAGSVSIRKYEVSENGDF